MGSQPNRDCNPRRMLPSSQLRKPTSMRERLELAPPFDPRYHLIFRMPAGQNRNEVHKISGRRSRNRSATWCPPLVTRWESFLNNLVATRRSRYCHPAVGSSLREDAVHLPMLVKSTGRVEKGR